MECPETVKALLKTRARVNEASKPDGLTPLMLAADNGYPQTVEALLDANAEVNARDRNGSTALIKAASKRACRCCGDIVGERCRSKL